MIDPKIFDLIHQPSRLRIMTYLYTFEEIGVKLLKRKIDLSWGNISSHMSKLEEVGLIEINKEIMNKKTNTTLKITELGKTSYELYRKELESILKKPSN